MPMTTEKLDAVNKEPSLIKFMQAPLTYQKDTLDITIDYYHASTLPPHLIQWTFELTKTNMYDLYIRSNDGWNEQGKKAELQANEARFLIARSTHDPTDLKGFLMFQMVEEETMDEDDRMAEVAYCYELQLTESARNQGLGDYLMKLLFDIGQYWHMEKVMLTVFKENKGAMQFYMRIGFELDEISPGACLPKKKAKKFDYEILSRQCS